MTINTVSAQDIKFPVVLPVTATVKGYQVERRYVGDRTASQVVSALMQVHDHKGAA